MTYVSGHSQEIRGLLASGEVDLAQRARAIVAQWDKHPRASNPMTQEQHPITPPPELFKQWFKQWEDDILNERDSVDHVLDRAWRDGFQAGADQELEACCEWVSQWRCMVGGSRPEVGLRACRRPKPPSLKEKAIEALAQVHHAIEQPIAITIRRALEALPDD